MPAPLIWLGAALASAYAGNEINKRYLKHNRVVGTFPDESAHRVEAVNGSVVCCGIYGVLEHTGIWLDGKIVELNGNGLVRAISPTRFLENRSGEKIYIACNEQFDVVQSKQAIEFCLEHIYTYRNYDVLDNNCHRFVCEAITGSPIPITSFSDLNECLSEFCSSALHWHKLKY